MATGLFHIHMLAGVESENRRRSMPVIGRGNPYRVHTLVVENLSQIFDGLGRLAFDPFRVLGVCGQPLLVHIAEIRQFHIGPRRQQADVIASHASGSDDGNRHPIGCGALSGAGEAQSGSARSQLLQKGTTFRGGHRFGSRQDALRPVGWGASWQRELCEASRGERGYPR
jgi:hypothetical protein